MKKIPIVKEFKEKGYTLERFQSGDTRRIGNEENYRWYASRGGMLAKKFISLEDARTWIEFK
jgi:hypothetical protein